jgi:hypothetical protein
MQETLEYKCSLTNVECYIRKMGWVALPQGNSVNKCLAREGMLGSCGYGHKHCCYVCNDIYKGCRILGEDGLVRLIKKRKISSMLQSYICRI